MTEREISFVNNAKKIVQEYDCIQLFTNDILFYYLLRKPSCTIYYFPITVGSKKNQLKFNESMINTRIIISDISNHSFSPNYRLKFTKNYIDNYYENIYAEDIWIIKRKINY